MNCPRCGFELADGSAICIECGTVFRKPTDAAARPAAPAPRPPAGPRLAVPMQPPVPPPLPRPAAPAAPEARPAEAAPRGHAPPEKRPQSLAAEPIKPGVRLTPEQAAAAVKAVAAVSRRARETKGGASFSDGGWRPSIAGILVALLLLAGIAGAVVYVQLPPKVPPVPGSWVSEAGRFALRPPENWALVGSPEAFEEIRKSVGGKVPEWFARQFVREPPAVAFLKVVGEADPLPALAVRAVPGGESGLDEAERRIAAVTLAGGLGGLFDSIDVGPALAATVDGLPAVRITAVGQRKALLTPSETIYREVAGGYEIAGRSEELWSVRRVRFEHLLVAGHGQRFLVTLAADEAIFHRFDIPMQTFLSSFRALTRPPLLKPEFRQLVLSAAGAVAVVTLIYLGAALVAIVRRRA